MFPEPLTSQREGLRRSPLTILLLTLWVAAMGFQGCATVGTDSRQVQEDPKSRQIQASFLSVPLSFEANEGQTDAQVKFLSRGPGYGLFLTPSEAVLALRQAKPTQSEAATEENPSESAVLRMRLVGANPNPELSGETALPGKVNYFKGNDPAKWRTNVPTYAQARYTNVYPGIDLVYYGNQRQLEYDFVVAPGQDPTSITMAFEGADRLELEASGDLVLQTSGGVIRQRKPVIYQEVEGQRQAIVGSYVVKTPDQVSFQVAAYDTTKPLIIDPILVFSTYLGGSNSDWGGQSVAADNLGNVYIIGFTNSVDFPTQNPFQPAYGGGIWDAFVAKLTADGSALVYSTYLGGSDIEFGYDITVDDKGQVYVTGETGSANFPTRNPFQSAYGGNRDAFVAQLSEIGALVFSTYLGGRNFDSGSGIAVDQAGQAYVTGRAQSPDFPTKNPLQPAQGGGFFDSDAFVTKLTSDGSGLVYSTYLGGSQLDQGFGIAVDGVGQVSVTGETLSPDFPTLNAVQPTFAGGATSGSGDGFVAKVTADGSALVYSTYLGGGGLDQGLGIAVDDAGQGYVTGVTGSDDFPIKNPLQPARGGAIAVDAFVAQLTVDGGLVYSTYLGGSNSDVGASIVVDGAGQVYLTGSTRSGDFPTKNPLQPSRAGFLNAFVSQLTADGSALAFSTQFGGSNNDRGLGIALDSAGQIYVTGDAHSTDFPILNGLQPVFGGGDRDAFVAKINMRVQNLNDKFSPLGPGDVTTAFSFTPCGGSAAGTFTITATFTNMSADTLSNLVVAVNTLTGGNVLCNADSGPGGAGATLTVPLEGDLADGQLSPGEAFVVELPVGLQSFNPFTFLVDVLGEEDVP